MRHLNFLSRTSFEQGGDIPRKKIAFMFLTKREVFHQELWQRFFNHYEDRCGAFEAVHWPCIFFPIIMFTSPIVLPHKLLAPTCADVCSRNFDITASSKFGQIYGDTDFGLVKPGWRWTIAISSAVCGDHVVLRLICASCVYFQIFRIHTHHWSWWSMHLVFSIDGCGIRVTCRYSLYVHHSQAEFSFPQGSFFARNAHISSRIKVCAACWRSWKICPINVLYQRAQCIVLSDADATVNVKKIKRKIENISMNHQSWW